MWFEISSTSFLSLHPVKLCRMALFRRLLQSSLASALPLRPFLLSLFRCDRRTFCSIPSCGWRCSPLRHGHRNEKKNRTRSRSSGRRWPLPWRVASVALERRRSREKNEDHHLRWIPLCPSRGSPQQHCVAFTLTGDSVSVSRLMNYNERMCVCVDFYTTKLASPIKHWA